LIDLKKDDSANDGFFKDAIQKMINSKSFKEISDRERLSSNNK
jgi:hypothetical protein